MNRIILIGNGFDIANGLETRYSDFIIWLWKKLNSKYNSYIIESKSECIIKGLVTYVPFTTPQAIDPIYLIPKNDVFINLTQTSQLCRIRFDNEFFKIITTNFKNKNWVDIEEDYFSMLKKCLIGKYAGGIEKLNKDFDIIKEELAEYLNSELEEKKNSKICFQNIEQAFYITDFSSLGKDMLKEEYFSENEERKLLFDQYIKRLGFINNHIESYNLNINPNSVLFLNFNYTDLPTKILNIIRINNWQLDDWAKKPMDCIYIHGELKNQHNPMIFGYGDELDEDHKIIEKRGGDFLNNIKTINYLKTGNYKKLLSFIESGYYQVFIFGHSCGFSDKTLLNTLFEHKHCASIKPFYHEWDDKENIKHNNYDEIIKSIYRVFTDKSSMRDKVVDKTHCQPLAQQNKQ